MTFLPRPPSRAAAIAAAVGAAAWILGAAAGRAVPRAKPPAERTVVISPEVRVSIMPEGAIWLSARPLPGEGLDAFVQRLTQDPKSKREILSSNENLRRVRADQYIRVPYRLLTGSFRKVAIEALFPEDRATAEGWEHKITGIAGRPESLWEISEWLTGDGANYRKVREASAIASLETRDGQVVRVPADLLLPPFREAVAAAAPKESGPPDLEYGSDERGPYAVYRLKKGEALYSGVVVRFTGRVHAEDVNAKAREIAERSGVADVRTMPVGFPVKIPVADLSPEFRPPGDPERVEEENARAETAQFANTVRSADLSGVTLVLDAGHGGRDTGAMVDGLEEAAHVYDIACRVERIAIVAHAGEGRADRRPRRAVSRGVVGRRRGFARRPGADVAAVSDRGRGGGGELPLVPGQRRLRQGSRGRPGGEMVFVSLHADSLHPAVRGTMVYVPGEKFLSGSFGKDGEPYASRREVRESSRVSFTRKERVEAEGVSRDLAEHIVGSFREAGLPLHEFQPIRRNVIRGGREWVPAILRYNRIPARVLVEVCNLNNPDDRRLLRTRAYREKVAEASSRPSWTSTAGARTNAAAGGTRRPAPEKNRIAVEEVEPMRIRNGPRGRVAAGRRRASRRDRACPRPGVARRQGAHRRRGQGRQGTPDSRREGDAALGKERARRARPRDGQERPLVDLRPRRRPVGRGLRGRGLRGQEDPDPAPGGRAQRQRRHPARAAEGPGARRRRPAEAAIMVDGKKISKETAAAIEAGNAAMNEKKWSAARESYSKALAEIPTIPRSSSAWRSRTSERATRTTP
jgi:N-acetylmuramoyl-L-alanine amidase